MASGTGVPLAQLLGEISPQLLALGTQMAKLEEVIGPTLSRDTEVPTATILEIQALDRIRQGVLDLARLTRHLSEVAVEGAVLPCQLDAIAQTLHLSSTKSLLCGNADQCPGAEKSIEASDLQLF